jgi:hypothetical protein
MAGMSQTWLLSCHDQRVPAEPPLAKAETLLGTETPLPEIEAPPGETELPLEPETLLAGMEGLSETERLLREI